MGLNESNTVCDGFLVAGAFDDGGFVLGGEDLVAGTEDFHADFFELHAFVAGNNGGVGQDGDIFHDFFAAITEGWGFEDEGVEDAFEFVQDQDRESFAGNFLGDDDEVFATVEARRIARGWDKFLGAADFFVGDKDEGFSKRASWRLVSVTKKGEE